VNAEASLRKNANQQFALPLAQDKKARQFPLLIFNAFPDSAEPKTGAIILVSL